MAKEQMDKSLGPVQIYHAVYDAFLLSLDCFRDLLSLKSSLRVRLSVFPIHPPLCVGRLALGSFFFLFISRYDAYQLSHYSCCRLGFIGCYYHIKRMEYTWKFQ